jgi:hypothetical protein
MLESRLYVSRSRLTTPGSNREIEEIVRLARSRNEERGITGALIFTDTSFAQIIEGEKAALDELMCSILKDPRHADVQVVRHLAVRERHFHRWSMAYSGPSFYVKRHIKPLLDSWDMSEDKSRRVERLATLISEFSVEGDGSLVAA